MAEPMEAPKQAGMDDMLGIGGTPHLLVKQTARGCFQECLGCEARNEYIISEHDWSHDARGWLQAGARNQKDVLYALEKSGCIQRCCCKDGRAMEMPVTAFNPAGQKGAGGEVRMTLKKDLGCPVTVQLQSENGSVDIPCCCFLPEFRAYDANDNLFSNTKYVCDINLLVPKFDYYEQGQVVYRLRPPTCLGGCCIDCECQSRGACNVTTPFYFYLPTGEQVTDGQRERHDMPQITQVWGGLAKECCTTADTFAIKFPQDANGERKAGLLAATMLIDFAWFEGHNRNTAVE